MQKVDAETNDLCKRLEAKIEALTQMGTELEEENKGNKWIDELM